MTTKIPKYTGRKFVRPFSRNVGRRTGRNLKAGKNIRVNKDGFEEFDDYMSESDADLTREHVLMRSICEESQSSEGNGKENLASQANTIVSQSVPSHTSFYDSSVSQSQLSQGGKINNRSKFAWLRNRNIGRRTGKDVRGSKQIRLDEDGFEVFEDYLSPPSGAESFLSVSSVQSQKSKSTRRKSELIESKDAGIYEPQPGADITGSYLAGGKHRQSLCESGQNSEINVRDNNRTLHQNSQMKCDSRLEHHFSNESQILNSHSNQNQEVQSQLVSQPNDYSRHELDTKQTENGDVLSENTEFVSDHYVSEDKDEVDNLPKMNYERLSVTKKANSKGQNAKKNLINSVSDSPEKNTNVHEVQNLQSPRHTTVMKDKYQDKINEESDTESEDYDSHIEDENPEASQFKTKNSAHKSEADDSYSYEDEMESDEEIKADQSKKLGQEHRRAQSVREQEEPSSELDSETENDIEKTGPKVSLTGASMTENHVNDSQKSVDLNLEHDSSFVNECVDNDTERRLRDHSKPEKLKSDIGVSVKTKTIKGQLLKNYNHSCLKDDTCKDNESANKLTHISQDNVPSHLLKPVSPHTVHKSACINETNRDSEDEELGPSSQTGIDVAGNRSGSITKLDIPDTSKVSFDRTRKRLSYSALELSDETKKARKSRVKEANQSLQEKPFRSKSDRLNSSGRESVGEKVFKQVQKVSACKTKSTGNKAGLASNRFESESNQTEHGENRKALIGKRTESLSDLINSRNKDAGIQSETDRHNSEDGGHYYEPSEFVCLASVGRRRSTYVSNKDFDSDDDIEIVDDRKRKSVLSKNATDRRKKTSDKSANLEAITKNYTEEKGKLEKKKTAKNKSTVKSNRSVKSDNDEKPEYKDGKQIHTRINDKHSSMTEKGQKKVKGSVSESKNLASFKPFRISLSDHHDSEIEIIDDKPKQRQRRKTVTENKHSAYDIQKEHSTDNEELYTEDINEIEKTVTNMKQSRRNKDSSNETANKMIGNDDKLAEMINTDKISKSKKSRSKQMKSAVIGKSSQIDEKSNHGKLSIKQKISSKQSATAISVKDDEVVNTKESVPAKSKQIREAKSKTCGKSVLGIDKISLRKTRSQKNGRSQSLTRNCKLKSVSSLKSNKRKTVNENHTSQVDNDSVSKPKKNKTDADSQQSAKRKLEFNRKLTLSKSSKKKSKTVAVENDDLETASPGNKTAGNNSIGTPVADSILTAPTNFNSGISFRVSRRSELLDNISSGYGNVPNKTVEMQPVEGLTPCITKGGKSRKSKGRRVSIYIESDSHQQPETSFDSKNVVNSKGATKNNRKSRNSSRGTLLPSVSSSPYHYCEVTHTGTPHPGPSSMEALEDRLIRPEPAPEGLRRSKRTRLKPIARYKNEKIIYDRRRSNGWVILGVKQSLEVKWAKLEEEKRKKRQLLNQIRKASQKKVTGKGDRKLSMHIKLPDNAHPTTESEISVVNPDTEETLLMDCIATADSCSAVGPHHGSPKKEDPYLIKKLIDQPIMSSGHLILRPGEEKSPQLVCNHAVVFMIHYGKVLITIHNTTSLLETGDSFFVPYGSSYSIQNLRHDTATLFYVILKRCEIG